MSEIGNNDCKASSVFVNTEENEILFYSNIANIRLQTRWVSISISECVRERLLILPRFTDRWPSKCI